jgi:hypothetical protein
MAAGRPRKEEARQEPVESSEPEDEGQEQELEGEDPHLYHESEEDMNTKVWGLLNVDIKLWAVPR